MKKKNTLFLTLVMLLGSTNVLLAQLPASPVNLQADVEGCKVSLSWQRGGDEGLLTYEGFESETFPTEGWETKKLNTTDYRCSWFHYPTDDFIELDNWDYYIYNGEGSAMVYMDMGYHDGIAYNQDEWLISPIYDNASYLDFWYYINPMILDYAQYPDFVDKYCIEISHDGGENWETIWDVRNYHNGLDGWQQASIYLGEPTPNTRIAFHAQSDMSSEWSMLYFSWTIDDVVISSNGASAATKQSIKKNNSRHISESMQSYKPFVSKADKKITRQNKIQEDVIEPLSYYQVYINGELIADKLLSLAYVDTSEKEAGTYTYEVKAVNTSGSSESTSVEVTIAESTFNAPTNVKVTSEFFEEEGWSEVIITWDAPEGDRKPAYYSIYVNGILVGVEVPLGEFGNTWVKKGVYTYEVAAVYLYPYGESVRVGEQVAIETRCTPTDLVATLDVASNSVLLSWKATKETDFGITSYKVYRGNTEIAEIASSETPTYTDSNIANGCYTYSVKALYDDGYLSLPIQQIVTTEDVALIDLPYIQNFDGNLTPDNWKTEMLNEVDPMYYWRFDNWFDIESPCANGNFASISSLESEFVNIISSLTTPTFNCLNVPEGEKVILSCAMDYYSEWDMSYMCLEVSNDGGETWNLFTDVYATDIEDNKYEVDVTSIAEGNTPMFRFVYDGCGDGYVVIDNFKVEVTDVMGVDKVDKKGLSITMCATNQLRIASTSVIEDVRLYNTNGMLLEMYAGNKSDNLLLNVDNLPEGLYIVKVKDVERTEIVKIVVR